MWCNSQGVIESEEVGIAINLAANHQCGLNCVPNEVAKTHTANLPDEIRSD